MASRMSKMRPGFRSTATRRLLKTKRRGQKYLKQVSNRSIFWRHLSAEAKSGFLAAQALAKPAVHEMAVVVTRQRA